MRRKYVAVFQVADAVRSHAGGDALLETWTGTGCLGQGGDWSQKTLSHCTQ